MLGQCEETAGQANRGQEDDKDSSAVRGEEIEQMWRVEMGTETAGSQAEESAGDGDDETDGGTVGKPKPKASGEEAATIDERVDDTPDKVGPEVVEAVEAVGDAEGEGQKVDGQDEREPASGRGTNGETEKDDDGKEEAGGGKESEDTTSCSKQQTDEGEREEEEEEGGGGGGVKGVKFPKTMDGLMTMRDDEVRLVRQALDLALWHHREGGKADSSDESSSSSSSWYTEEEEEEKKEEEKEEKEKDEEKEEKEKDEEKEEEEEKEKDEEKTSAEKATSPAELKSSSPRVPDRVSKGEADGGGESEAPAHESCRLVGEPAVEMEEARGESPVPGGDDVGSGTAAAAGPLGSRTNKPSPPLTVLPGGGAVQPHQQAEAVARLASFRFVAPMTAGERVGGEKEKGKGKEEERKEGGSVEACTAGEVAPATDESAPPTVAVADRPSVRPSTAVTIGPESEETRKGGPCLGGEAMMMTSLLFKSLPPTAGAAVCLGAGERVGGGGGGRAAEEAAASGACRAARKSHESWAGKKSGAKEEGEEEERMRREEWKKLGVVVMKMMADEEDRRLKGAGQQQQQPEREARACPEEKEELSKDRELSRGDDQRRGEKEKKKVTFENSGEKQEPPKGEKNESCRIGREVRR